MSSWKDWPCIAVGFEPEEIHREIAQYFKKYLKRKGKRVIEQTQDWYESYFYIREEKVLTYVLLRWGAYVTRIPTFNESKEEFKKEDREHRIQSREAARKHLEDINRILSKITDPVDDGGSGSEQNNTQTFAVRHQGPYTHFDIEVNCALHELGEK